jgi:acetolactate synthase-1/2/3 large subunit
MSDIASHLVGRDLGALHEVPNQIECFRSVTRWAEAITDAASIPTSLAGAFDLLRTGRPGPMALSIPHDLLAARVDTVMPASGGGARPPCHVEDIAHAARLLAGASRPLIIAGGGVVSAGAADELRSVAERLGAPVITTVMGRGAMDERHPLWHSVLPDRRYTVAALTAADVVFAVGCKFGHRSMDKLGAGLTDEQALIHLDVDPAVIGRVFKPRVAIIGDARDGLAGLAAALGTGAPAAGWDRAALAAVRRDPGPRWTPAIAELMGTLRRALPDDAIVVNDQTGLTYWAEWRLPVYAPRTFLYPVGSATLGYAVPAAIGAKIARPHAPVIAIAGDGGFMFSVAELATAVKYRLPIAFLLVNDNRYGAIKFLQEKLFEGRWGETELSNPDFVALARSFGARAERVEKIAALPDLLAAAFAASAPTVIELQAAIEPPWDG